MAADHTVTVTVQEHTTSLRTFGGETPLRIPAYTVDDQEGTTVYVADALWGCLCLAGRQKMSKQCSRLNEPYIIRLVISKFQYEDSYAEARLKGNRRRVRYLTETGLAHCTRLCQQHIVLCTECSPPVESSSSSDEAVEITAVPGYLRYKRKWDEVYKKPIVREILRPRPTVAVRTPLEVVRQRALAARNAVDLTLRL